MSADTTTMNEVAAAHRERCVKALSRRPVSALDATIKLIDLLTFKDASFGFTTDRLTVTGPHAEPPTDPTTYIVDRTRAYFDSWVLPQLNLSVGLPTKFAANTFDELREWCTAAMKRSRRTHGED